jgi:hypothetical protein
VKLWLGRPSAANSARNKGFREGYGVEEEVWEKYVASK